MREAFTRSPHELDPLSWFVGPLMPLVFGLLTCLYGLLMTVVTWGDTPVPVLQLVALAWITGSSGIVYLLTRPHRPELSLRNAFLVMVFAWAGLVLSAAEYAPGELRLETWWAPLGVGFVLGSLTPYLAVRRIAMFGLLSTAVGILVAVTWFLAPDGFWPPITRLALAAGPILVSAVATTTFSYQMVSGFLRYPGEQAESANVSVTSPSAGDESGRYGPIQGELARVGREVTPLLDRIARTGRITDDDRRLADELTRRLRDDLVSRSNRSWLDSVAQGRPLAVIDPEHRANSMTSVQRTAVRGLLLAVLESPVLDRDSLVIELRGQDDGSTAVALSMHLDLPEGRRVTMLAPYYLTLKTTVDNLTWDSGEDLRLKFQLPPTT